MAKLNETDSGTAVNLISQGTEITGDVKSTGDIRIDGVLNGNLIQRGKWSSDPPAGSRERLNAKTPRYQA